MYVHDQPTTFLLIGSKSEGTTIAILHWTVFYFFV